VTNEETTEAVLALADAIESKLGPPPPDPSLGLPTGGVEPLVHQLVYSTLLWESSHENAESCLGAIAGEVVDFNELRVCSVSEVRDMLPRSCPKRDERAARLLGGLNAVFEREHALTLAALGALPKRDARQYLDALDGVPQFVAARVLLVSLGGHAFPADERLCQLLRSAKAIPADKAPAAEVGARLERAVRAADAPRVYALLEAQAEAESVARKSRARAGAPAGTTGAES
jgi:hypothetical protein